MTASFDERARATLPSRGELAQHDAAVWDLRRRRDAAAAEVPDWEALRERAAALKAFSLDHLDELLVGFEQRARGAGAHVHWATDATALCRIVTELLAARGSRRVVKSKSMLTEECGLNPHLAARGIDVVDTDLGERIVQLAGEAPSHLIVPAIHKTRREIGALFHRQMGTPEGEDDPERLTRHARSDLRQRFLAADAGITGANFAVADTGSIVIVTNEGNADLGSSLPPLHIACIGIEKVVPALSDLPVFLRLLARSATGQPISAYTSVLTGPRSGGELHIVLVDNGRSELLADPTHRSALACIRCGACLNTCPVYRRAGGHAYGTVIPGPIGSVLGPALGGKQGAELPHASTLCGSCSAVCPVKIDLHGQLLAWRGERRRPARGERLLTRAAAIALRWPAVRGGARALLRPLWPLLARRHPRNPAEPWLTVRELPPLPKQSFRQQWQAKRARLPASQQAGRPAGAQRAERAKEEAGGAASGANSSRPVSKPAVRPARSERSERRKKPGAQRASPSKQQVGPRQAPRPGRAPRAERAKEEVLSERDDILARVRRGALRRAAHPGPHPAPALPGGWEVFAAMLARVGGEAHGPFAPHALGAALAELVRQRADGGRCVAEPSAAELAGRGPFETARAPGAPHGFADVSVAIVRGHAAAADCAAVALLERDAPNRALPFLCQRLVLLLPVAAIHPDLHSAWAALPETATRGHHVTWISGPSKTADIEQTLVYGAHGPLGLDVVGIAD